jgi:copper chaperone NosL
VNRRASVGFSLFLAFALAGLALAGCGSGQAKIAPPTIYYGEDICDQCGMIISDERFAAASVVELSPGRTDTHVFDDIGGMLLYQQSHPAEKVLARYVHDYNTKAWLAAGDAFYVTGETIHSPMGHGVAALATQDAAAELAAAMDAEVIDYAGLTAMADAGMFDAAHAGDMQKMDMDTDGNQ